MKIQTFLLKVTTKEDGTQELDHSTKILNEEIPAVEFDESQLALKAQEVAEHNKSELTIVQSMGAGDKFIDFKLIV